MEEVVNFYCTNSNSSGATVTEWVWSWFIMVSEKKNKTYEQLYGKEKAKMNMKNIVIIITLLAIIVLPLVPAQLVYTQGVNFDLKIPCQFNNTYCSVAAICNLTLIDPNSSVIIDNEQMENQYAYHNYSITSSQVSATGIYPTTVACYDQGFNGLDAFEIVITNNGELPDTGKSIIDLAMLFGLLLLFSFSVFGIFKVSDIRGKFSLYWVSHLLAIAITFIAWTSASSISYNPFVGDFFRIMFLVLLISFLPMVFMSIFFIIKFHFINKNVMDLVNAGYGEEDAWRLAERAAKE